jgi:para-nitrobenzyl esterase
LLDGHVLPKNLDQAFEQGKFNDVPFIGGWVSGDGALFPSPAASPEQFAARIHEQCGASAEKLLAALPHSNTAEVEAAQKKMNLISFAVLGMHRWAQYSKKPAYLYEYTHVPPDKPGFPNYGAFHTSEVPYALKNLDHWNRSWQPMDRALEKSMSYYWLNFIRKGDPNGKGLPSWSSFYYPDGSIIELGDRIESREGMYAEVLRLLMPQQR